MDQVLTWLIEGRREDVNLAFDETFTSAEAATLALEASLTDLRASGAIRATLLDRAKVIQVRDLRS